MLSKHFLRYSQKFPDREIKLWSKLPGKRNYQSKKGVYGHKEMEHPQSPGVGDLISRQFKLPKQFLLVNNYREHGHKISSVNPLDEGRVREIPELNFENFDLCLKDECDFKGMVYSADSCKTIEEAVRYLHHAYCGTISAEFTYIEDIEEREWFAQHFEGLSQTHLSRDEKLSIHREMVKSQALDNFLAKKFVSLKRYGGEGAESMMPFFMELLSSTAQDGVKTLVIGAHHRGRLNLLTGLLGMDPALLFRKLQGKTEFPEHYNFTGDVISHLCPSSQLDINGKKIKIVMTHLPSHLEAVSPVSLGKTRCYQKLAKESHYGNKDQQWGETVLNVQVHGDAALMGQGVSQESLILSGLPHFNVGGTIHLIINNQLGFTTSPTYGRGTKYASDIGKIINAPVIHVNGDDPEAVFKAARLAVKYQRKFRKNIFIDLNCFRRWGHNELDDPTFTNPLLYQVIHNRKSVPDNYSEKLVTEGLLISSEVEDINKFHMDFLNDRLRNVDSFSPIDDVFEGEWKGYCQAPSALTVWDTGVDENILKFVGKASVSYPTSFNVHEHLARTHVSGRLSKLNDGKIIDWATAEALALGSLLFQGYNVRISGQDVGRGTFSHRHVMLVDQKTDEIFIPFNHMSPEQTGFLEVANSMLSEEAVLGFEYGFSSISPHYLVIWEAQFGDFFNGAQIQVDTYVTSGESKWLSMSGMVMLLPHGYDGAGPEHSSCRLERFLQLSDSSEVFCDGEDVNVHIVNPTTPAQYFHLLRRQMVRNYRKPLIVVAPKTLLRAADATSSLNDMGPNSRFHSVLGDNFIQEPKGIQKVIFVCGKHYYALNSLRKQISINNVAIIRIEELSPFPVQQIQDQIKKYPNAKDFIWSQEEPQNMGAWAFCRPRFENLVGVKLKYCGRKPLPCPAVGIGDLHKKEADDVIKSPFEN